MEDEENNAYRPMDTVLAPIFIQMMKNSARNNPGADMNSQLQEILRRRGRRPVSIDQLLQGIRTGLTLAPADDDTNNAPAADDNNRERGRVIVTNPYNQIVAVPSSAVSDTLPPVAADSLSEYFIGPEFEAFLENLTETDPRRYGTPPARRDAFEALANVIIVEPGLQCSVCLDDFEVGDAGKQTPCNHRFHPHCLLPWLQLHSSCPVCRYQLPSVGDETMTETDPRRYGTHRARRDAVEALVDVIVLVPGMQCLVCLEDFEMGTVGKQMPCEHSFHSYCLLYWLGLHSSCPVCRCQLPTAEDGTNGGGGGGSSASGSQGSENGDQEEDSMAA